MFRYITNSFRWFFKLEAASGLLLLVAAIIALIVSNSNYSDLYFSTLNKYLFIGINNIGLKVIKLSESQQFSSKSKEITSNS